MGIIKKCVALQQITNYTNNMKHLVLIFGLGMLAWAGVQATEISQRHAAQLADRFYSQRAALQGLRSAGASALAYTFQQEGTNAIYVYNNEAQESFVLVAGDDRVAPILGYSDQCTFDYANLPINAKAFFEQYAQEIASLRADEEEEEAKPIMTFDTAVEPLLKSKWGQQDPYDLYTPAIEGQQTPSGCVATAMAQVMYYHQWPERGTGSVSYTSHSSPIASQSVNIDLSADFSQSVYQWDQMTDTYDANSTEAARKAVAKLMQDCGIAVQMQYGINGSGASNNSAPYALVNYFNYDKGIRTRHAYTMSDSAWVYLLKEELDAKRPMLHMGSLPTGMGHAFVCDGYNKEGYFHINWGWNGESDGYFLLTNLAPKRHGVGGGEDGANFNAARVVMTGIQRPQSEAPVVIPYELTYDHRHVEYIDHTAYQLGAIDDSHIQISMTVDNSGYDAFSGTVYAIPYDYETGKDCGEAQLLWTIDKLENTEFQTIPPSSASFSVAGLPDGSYRFRFESEDKNGVRLPLANPEVINMFVPYVTIAGGAMSFQNMYPMSVSHVTFELISSENEIPSYLVSADWTNTGNQPVSLKTGLTFSYRDTSGYLDEEEQEIAYESIWFDDTLFQPGETKRIGRVFTFEPENEYQTYTSKFEEIEPQPIVLLSERLLQFVEGKLDTDGPAALRVKLHNVASEPRQVQVVAKLFPKGAQQAVATAEGKIELPESYGRPSLEVSYTKGIGELTISLPAGLAAGDYYALLYTDEDEPIKVADSEENARIDFTLAQATANEAIATEAEVVRQGNLLLIQAAGEVKAVQLYDVQGRLCLKGEGKTVDLSALPTGIYFLHYQLNGVAKVQKVIR